MALTMVYMVVWMLMSYDSLLRCLIMFAFCGGVSVWWWVEWCSLQVVAADDCQCFLGKYILFHLEHTIILILIA